MLFQDTSFLLVFTLAIPLVGVMVSCVVKDEKHRDICLILVSIFLFLNVANLFSILVDRPIDSLVLAELFPGLSISFTLEPMGMIFALVASFLWVVTTLYAIGYLRGNKVPHQSRFYAFFSLSIFATMGIAMSGNVLTLFLFYELLTLSTFPLVTHNGTEEAKKAGRTYLGLLLGGSISLFLVAIIWTWNLAGTLDFQPNGILHTVKGLSPVVVGVLLFLYVYGIGKAALMPMHRWLPAAMVAPTPVSALLHAVAVVKAGVFSILKIVVFIFGHHPLQQWISEEWWAGGWLTWIAGFTIIAASVIALHQNSIKRMLAYSTISQLSYIIIAVSILAPTSIVAALFHIVAHAVSKITLFFAAGSIYTASGKKNIDELNGIGRRMPITMGAFAIAALSMIGLPPTVGFITKYYLMIGALDSGSFVTIGVVIVSTLLNTAYFVPIIIRAFFMPENVKPSRNHGEAPIAIVLAIVITATLTIGLFALPDIFIEPVSQSILQ